MTSGDRTGTRRSAIRMRAISLAAATLLVLMQAVAPASVFAVDGDGSVTVSPTSMVASSTGTLTFTYTVGAAWTSATTAVHMQIAVPTAAGFTTPTTGAGAGHIAISSENCSGTPGLGVGGGGNNLIQLSGNSGTGCAAGAQIVITYSTTAPSSTGSRTFTASTRTSGSSGSLQVIASSPSVNITAGAATQLVITTSAKTITAGTTPSSTITVQIQDASGNPVDQAGSTRTVDLATTSAGGSFRDTGDASTITSVTIPVGSSSASFLYRDTVAGSPTITVSTTTPSSLTSDTQGVTVNAGTPTQLAITSVNGGSNPTAGVAFSVVVRSKDAYGNFANVTSATGVSLSVLTGTGTLGGTTTGTIALNASTATINNVTYSKAETGVSLRAARTSGMALAAGDSATFTVVSSDGSGTMTANTAKVGTTTYTTFPIVAGMNMELIDYNFTATSALGAGSRVTLVIPTGWTEPTKTAGSPPTPKAWGALSVLSSTCTAPATGTGGFTISGSGPWTISVDAQCTAGQTFSLRYGNGSGYLVQAPSATGLNEFTTQTAGPGGTLAPIATQPTLNVVGGKLVFIQNPTNTVAGASITPSVTVQLRDSADTNVYSLGSVTVAIGANPGTGTLSGTKTVAMASGLATFGGLSIDKAGTGYTLTATTAGATDGTSGTFNITAATASRLVITSVNGGSDPTVGTFFSVVVQAQDAYGNPANVTSNTGIGLSVATGTGFLGGTTAGQIDSGSSSVTISGVTYTRAETGVSLTATRTSGMTPLAPGTSATFTVVVAGTTTALSSIPNPSVVGESVTFTATVSPASGSGTPTGTVDFFDGATLLGSATLSGGVATLFTSTLSVGSHPATAVYSGDADYGASTSPEASQVVNQASTISVLTDDVNPSSFGQSVTFTATVAVAPPGAGTPTGTVTFFDGPTSLGTATLSGGVATLTTSLLTVGSHSIVAAYAGDTDSNGSTSPVLTQVVLQAGTTTTLTSNVNPSSFGQSVTFTATVAAVPPGAGTPTGNVGFFDGATLLGTAVLIGGVATITTSGLSVGSHPLMAVYGGATDFTASTSPVVTQVVDPATTTTALTSSLNPSSFGQAVTFTATVAAVAPAFGTPTGTVTFYDGPTPLATVPTLGGVATFTTSALSVGSHPMTAVYNGDADFGASTSPEVAQVVGLQSTTTTLTSDVNPSQAGQAVTFTATVADLAGSSWAGPMSFDGIPTGTVTFYDGLVSMGTATLDPSGVATFITSSLAVGAHPVTAAYNGDASHQQSTSPEVTQVVGLQPTTTTLASSLDPSIFGQPVTFTATVSDLAGGSGAGPAVDGIPTGTVEFFDGATSIGTATLSGGVATLTTTVLAVGSHPMTAAYGGDAEHAVSISPEVTQVVAGASEAQTITFTSTPPSRPVPGGSYRPTATATSGLPVTFSIPASSSAVCELTGGVVGFHARGTCVVEADQPGDADWDPAPTARQEFRVGATPPMPHPTEPAYPSFAPAPTVAPTAPPAPTPTPLTATALTITSTAHTIDWGDDLRLSATLEPASAGRLITFARSVDGGPWVDLDSAPTDASGQVTMFRIYDAKTNAKYRATFAGDGELAAATSAEITVLVRQTVVLRPYRPADSPEPVALGAEIVLTATVRPVTPPAAPTSVTFFIYRRDAAGTKWILAAKRTVAVDADGIGVLRYRPATAGLWYAVARAPATRVNLESGSSNRTYFSVS